MFYQVIKKKTTTTKPFKTGDKKALKLEKCHHWHKEMWIEMLSLIEGKGGRNILLL